MLVVFSVIVFLFIVASLTFMRDLSDSPVPAVFCMIIALVFTFVFWQKALTTKIKYVILPILSFYMVMAYPVRRLRVKSHNTLCRILRAVF